MKDVSVGERRHCNRSELALKYPVTITINGSTFCGQILNLSENGACFILDAAPGEVTLDPGTILEYAIHTPKGTGKRTAEIRWSAFDENRNVWGVRFGDTITGNGSDPLRILLNDPQW